MEEGAHQVELSQRAAAGDAVALKLLLTESWRRLCNHISRRIPADLRSTVDVEDIVQEAHVEVFHRIGAFQPHGPKAFYRWLVAIALSRLRNAIKRDRALKRGNARDATNDAARRSDDSTVALLDTLAGPGRTPSRCVARKEAIQAVQTAMVELPEHYRQAVMLVHIEGRSVREAASEMGRSERAIHGLCRRGLKLMHDQLESATRFLSSVG